MLEKKMNSRQQQSKQYLDLNGCYSKRTSSVLVVFSPNGLVMRSLSLNWTVQVDLSDGHKLKYRMFGLSIRKHFYFNKALALVI